MRKEELAKIKDFVEVGNGYGPKKVREIADTEWQAAVILLEARKTLLEQYRTEVRKAIYGVVKKGGYRDNYYGYVSRFLRLRIEEPGFDHANTSFQAVVQEAAQKAFAEVLREISDFLHGLLNKIGSDLEKPPQ
jgi:hypothetical protein